MSDLQLSLLLIGVIIVVGVAIMNWLQERSYQRRNRETFSHVADDVLLRPNVETKQDTRIEPSLGDDGEPSAKSALDGDTVPIAKMETSKPTAPSKATAKPIEFHKAAIVTEDKTLAVDPVVDYVIDVQSDTPIPSHLLRELVIKISALGPHARCVSLNEAKQRWEILNAASEGRYLKTKVALQLVSRKGPVDQSYLNMLCKMVQETLQNVTENISCPDIAESLERAATLNDLCNEADIAIGINIISRSGGGFAGTKIRALAESSGFKLEPNGVFYYFNDQGQPLFSIDNIEPVPFLPEAIRSISTSGITFVLDVPRVHEGARTLDRMIDVAKSFANALGGDVVDDNRNPLRDAGLEKIRQQLRHTYALMKTHEVQPGSARALRLLS